MESLIELRVLNIDNYNYTLVDKSDNKYNINIEFYDIDKCLNIGDYIYMNNELLNEKVLSFGSVKGDYGKELLDTNRDEIIIIRMENELIYLKRYYG